MSPALFNGINAQISAPFENIYNYKCLSIDFPGWLIVTQSLNQALNSNNSKSLLIVNDVTNELLKEQQELNFNSNSNSNMSENENSVSLNEETCDETINLSAYNYLNVMKNNIILPYKKIISKVIVKNVKGHINEAKLISLLEKKGIGRPSTFSSLVEKIQERGYVKKQSIEGRQLLCKDFELEGDTISEINTKRNYGIEHNKLVIQNLGLIVIEFLYNYFNPLFNYDYTRLMETKLDLISNEELDYYNVCKECVYELDNLITKLSEEKNSKLEYTIDDNHSFIYGAYGPVIKYITKDTNNKSIISFKKCIATPDLELLKNGGYKLEDLLVGDFNNNDDDNDSNISNDNSNNDTNDINDTNDTSNETSNETKQTNNSYNKTTNKTINKATNKATNKQEKGYLGEYNGEKIYLKSGSYGNYAIIGEKKLSLKKLGVRPLENIKLEEVIKILNQDNNEPKLLRVINEYLSIRKGPRGNYIFYKKPFMKKPIFYSIEKFKGDCNSDYLTCDIQLLISWITNNYNIRL